MKRRRNRLEVETVYVLGAGSSKALTDVTKRKNKFHRGTAPVDRDFLPSLNAFALRQGWQRHSLDLIKENWLRESPLLDCGLEEAVIKRVADYDMLSALYSDKSRRKCTNEDYLNNLSHLIAAFLLKCRSNNSGDTRTFVNHVFPLKQAVETYPNRIITFNYDLIVDRPLLERGISKRKMYFDRIGACESDGTKRAQGEKFPHPLLLKLHGSLNWRCTRTYFNQIISGSVDRNERIPIWTNDTKCPAPDDEESPLIIPPVPNKPITKASIFQMLWTTALEYLHEARRIVIVGYSCPSTDVLAQSMFSQFRNKNASEVVIVNRSSDALTRYHELMKGRLKAGVEWKYYADFRQYIAATTGRRAAED
jgi:hypothetical protein